jgi:hypothetical protein
MEPHPLEAGLEFAVADMAWLAGFAARAAPGSEMSYNGGSHKS